MVTKLCDCTDEVRGVEEWKGFGGGGWVLVGGSSVLVGVGEVGIRK